MQDISIHKTGPADLVLEAIDAEAKLLCAKNPRIASQVKAAVSSAKKIAGTFNGDPNIEVIVDRSPREWNDDEITVRVSVTGDRP